MGVFVPLLSGAQLEIVYSLDTVVVENRLWFLFDNPPFGVPEIIGLVNGALDWHTSMVLPYLSQDITLTRVQATDWTTDPPSFFPYSVGVSLAGGVASESQSANVGVVVPFRWPLGFRLKRNKNYIPGVPEADIALNTVSDTFTDAMFEAYAALVDAARDWAPALNWRWVVTSAFAGGIPRSEMLWKSSQGPSFARPYKLGQRRRRLP